MVVRLDDRRRDQNDIDSRARDPASQATKHAHRHGRKPPEARLIGLSGTRSRTRRVDDQDFYQLLDKDGISDDIHLFNDKLRSRPPPPWRRVVR